MNRKIGQKGFTLLELMVVIAIAAIVAAIGVPSLADFVRTNRLTTARSMLMSDLNLARSEAVKRNKRVLVCAANAARSDCSASTNWGVTGWIICYDGDGNGACDVASSTNPNPIQIRATSETTLIITGPSGPIRFNAIGSQGVAGNTGTSLTVSGNWVGAVSKTITVAGSGNITSY